MDRAEFWKISTWQFTIFLFLIPVGILSAYLTLPCLLGTLSFWCKVGGIGLIFILGGFFYIQETFFRAPHIYSIIVQIIYSYILTFVIAYIIVNIRNRERQKKTLITVGIIIIIIAISTFVYFEYDDYKRDQYKIERGYIPGISKSECDDRGFKWSGNGCYDNTSEKESAARSDYLNDIGTSNA